MGDLLELYRSSGVVGRLAELHELVLPTLEELTRTHGYERAFVAVFDEGQRRLQGAVGIEVPDELIETAEASEDDPGPLRQSLVSGKPLRVDNTLRDPRVPEERRGYYAAFGLLAFAAIPLLPVASVLIVSRDRPITEAEINELLPYAGRLVALMTERDEAHRLRQSGEQHAIEKEWLWWMLNTVQDPVILSDEQNNILLQNEPAERLFKASPDDSPGKRRAIQLNNVLLTAALSSFALGERSAMARELTLVDPIEGAELLFEVICRSATNLRTGERGLTSVLKDVTDLRRAALEVQRSLEEVQRAGEQAQRERDRLNLILGNVADPIVVTDPEGQIILMNHPAERLLQATHGRVRERTSTIYVANDAKLSSFLSQLRLEAARVRRGEIQLVYPETEVPRTMSVTATEVQDALGQVTAIVAVLHDLTMIRELERRTVEQQLFESEKLAAVGRLAATVAHEINNPLEAIKNALYLVVTRTPPDDPNRRFLEIASKETERVSGIIRQMLGFSRPKALRASTDVNRVIDEVLALLERRFRQSHVVLRADLAPGLPPVVASGDQLKQVFLNLILNGLEAMPNGGTLDVSTRLLRETDTEFLGERYVVAQIHDTGAGIPEEHLPHIFEPFYTTKSESKGTGLGLWVSLGIIQEHGGQIKVQSRPGRGTTFTIALPLGAE